MHARLLRLFVKQRDRRRCSGGTRYAACAAQPAKITLNSEPAGTTVAIGISNSANGYGGESI